MLLFLFVTYILSNVSRICIGKIYINKINIKKSKIQKGKKIYEKAIKSRGARVNKVVFVGVQWGGGGGVTHHPNIYNVIFL